MESGLTTGDLALMDRNNGMFGGDGGAFWIFALLILAGGGFGNWGNGNLNQVYGERVATQADIQRAVDFDTLKGSISGVNQTVITTGANVISAVKDLGYNQLGELRDVQNEMNQGFYNIQSALASGFTNMQSCCCDIKQSIMENRYLDAQNAAAIQATDTANTKKILDAISGNRMADMQNQINQLQLQNAMCGVVRYPVATTYNAGGNPFCNCNSGCGCGNF